MEGTERALICALGARVWRSGGAVIMIVGLFLPGRVFAESPAAIAAALPSEAAECAYLLELCDQKKKANEEAARIGASLAYCDGPSSPDCPVSPEREAVRRLVHQQGHALISAAEVIRMKHDTLPRCFQQCLRMLDLDVSQ